MNSTVPRVGPPSLLAQASATSKSAAAPDSAPFIPALAPSPPLRTPLPPLPPGSSSPTQSLLATAVPGRPRHPYPSSPLCPSASFHYLAPRLQLLVAGAGAQTRRSR